jgi:uncharacterized protein
MTESDLDRLEQYLDAPERTDDTLPLDAVQGFLAAVVSAPAFITPNVWIPSVLGEEHEFATEEEARDIIVLLNEFHDDIERQLNEGEGFDFIIYGAEDDPEQMAAWCEGYLIGVDIAEPSWEEGTEPEALTEMLSPFLLLSGRWKEDTLEAGEAWMVAAEEKRLQEEARDTIADVVLGNRRYWFERRIPDTVRRETPKVGRNEPCPCGSGKKYKSCHGA